MNNEFVAMVTYTCPVCFKEHSRNAEILIHKQMEPIKNTKAGYRLCEEHYKDGYVCLVEVNPVTECTTGTYMHVREEVYPQLFNIERGEHEFVFIEPSATEKLRSMIPE